MLGRTHLAIGLAATATAVTNIHALPVSLAVAGVASLIPDLDERHSLIRRKIDTAGIPTGLILLLATDAGMYMYVYIRLLSALLFAGFFVFAYLSPHRSFTHSFLGLLVFLSAIYTSFPQYIVPASIGYAAHLLADVCTNSGIELLWPWRKRFGLHLGQTGGVLDVLAGSAAVVLLVLEIVKKMI
ncbi:inner membrane protein [Caldanaerobius fijiensis DSM 17918]|uniref:Inner membrane protein n=1 Tax=Caldanaerobius fijiensis DSM 17918 TaxID=1121256 RepID=A0A1M5EMA7_9THEO|nr:metal-dependent hydrolase [Caldanaerobius fijiensis]SHF80162.1 inner membrane protein [Caldanaerobius fijiensis DSM 17918]